MSDLLAPEKKPLLSLCLIAGNEGTKTIARLLKSVLVRPGGPMVDEVIIGWNGSDDEAFGLAIAEFMEAEFQQGTIDCYGEQWELGKAVEVARPQGVPILVLRQKWVDNFAISRQQTFEAASGEWRMYLDCDDVVPIWDDDGPDGKACVKDSLREVGVDVDSLADPVGPPKTRQDYLRALEPGVNVVEFPYDYTIGGDGKTLWRYWRRRIVRWATGWVWREQVDFHEDIFPVGGNVVSFVRDAGLPIRHYPSQSVDERTARNRAILQKMLEETKRGVRPVDGRLLYNCATFELQSGNWAAAADLLDQATRATDSDADMRMYRHCRAKALIALGRYAEAVFEAAALNGHDAAAFEGWAIFTECSYNRGEWTACVEYGYHAIQAKVRQDATDKPVERKAHLRVMMATALTQRGQPDDFETALHLAEEAVGFAGQDALAKDCLKRVQAASTARAALDATVALAEHHEKQQDCKRLEAALAALPWSAPPHDHRVLRLRASLRRMLDDVPAADLAPLSIFRAPSPWARYVGSLAVREGWRVVRVIGRPHPDDMAALRALVPGVLWIDEARDADPDAIVRVDMAHVLVGTEPEITVDVFPAPGVVDPARRGVAGVREMPRTYEGWTTLQNLRLVTSSRPDADMPRVVVHTANGPARRRVDIFCPHWAEIWGPDALTDTGCGGSEEAVVYLTRELAKLGYEPHVYGPWRPPEGLEVRDGVWWHDIRDFNPAESSAPLIAHRAPWLLKDVSICALRQVYVWHHDHEYPDDGWTAELAKRGRHLYVSKWQEAGLTKQLGLEPGALYGAVVCNGVPREDYDVSDRATPPVRERDRVFYASQPQRGLLPLLRAWPLVLAEEPAAVLDVYYGWQTAEMLARSSQPQLWEQLREIDKLLRETPRVNARGRLPQARLAEEMLRAGVLAYPCTYPEVSCITGLRAAAAGCKIVYPKIAALPETMPDDTYALEAEGLTTEAFAVAIVRAIRDTNYPAEHVARMTLATCSWAAVAARVVDALEGRS